MTSTPKTTVDLSTITGKYPLFGLFLLVVESLLGFWMFKAGGPGERIAAGGLITIIFFGFLWAFLQSEKESKSGASPIAPEGLGKVTPAKHEASIAEVNSPEPQQMSSPDRAYLIDKPPEDWLVIEETLLNLTTTSMGLTDPVFVQNIRNEMEKTSDPDKVIFTLKTKTETSVLPIPGKSTIGGRKFPSALELNIPTRLTIEPIDRAQPPIFAEHPLIHNFMRAASQIMNLGVIPIKNISSGTLEVSGRKYMLAEFRQDISCATVNGIEGQDICSHLTIIGIEGEIRDYILMMQYPSKNADIDPVINKDISTLRSLVSSFKPLKIFNPEIQLASIREQANKKFEEILRVKGEEIFWTEFVIMIMRLGSLDLDFAEDRMKAIRYVKPFRAFASEIRLQNDEIDELWAALDDAEKSNASRFKESILKFLVQMREVALSKQAPSLEQKEAAAA